MVQLVECDTNIGISVPYQPYSPQDRIVKAGRKLFFEIGFSKVSTEMLAKEAGVSKATLYKYFPGMVEVLKAVTEIEAETFEAGVTKEVDDFAALQATLGKYGANLLRFLNQEDILQFSHLMHEEARAFPEIAAEFYGAAYGRTLKTIAEYFEQAIEKGFLATDLDPEELAEQLVGMWEGVPFVRSQLGGKRKPFPRPKDWAEKCVATLLNGAARAR